MRRHTQAQVSQPAPLLADFGDMRCNQTDRGGREDGWGEERFGGAEHEYIPAAPIFQCQEVVCQRIPDRW